MTDLTKAMLTHDNVNYICIHRQPPDDITIKKITPEQIDITLGAGVLELPEPKTMEEAISQIKQQKEHMNFQKNVMKMLMNGFSTAHQERTNYVREDECDELINQYPKKLSKAKRQISFFHEETSGYRKLLNKAETAIASLEKLF